MTPKQDSLFAKSILELVIRDNTSKEHLAFFAEILNNLVIKPILQKLEKADDLRPYEQKSIKILAYAHSKDDLQWGAVMLPFSNAKIVADRTLQIKLFKNLSTQLTKPHILAIQDLDDLACTIKSLNDAAFLYVEEFPEAIHSPDFDFIKRTIFPTPEELAIRIARNEIGQDTHFATSYGIGKMQDDIAPSNKIPASSARKHKAGKAFFDSADVYKRAQLTASSYDKLIKNREDYRANGDFENLLEIEKQLDPLKKKMLFYHIPLNPDERPEDFKKLPIPKPSIQKLSSLDPQKEPLPLIATVSGTSARTLITLHDIQAFMKDGKFNKDSAQYLSMILCGFMIHAGHHSLLEVAEIYNRLLDCQALQALDKGKLIHEIDLPYYRIGDAASLLPAAIKNAVVNHYHEKIEIDEKIAKIQPAPDSEKKGFQPK